MGEMDELFLVLIFSLNGKQKQQKIYTRDPVGVLKHWIWRGASVSSYSFHLLSASAGRGRESNLFERRAVDHIQGLTHKSFSKRHDTSARIKRNFLIKTIMPVCLRSVFIIRFQAHLCACAGPSKCSAVCTYLLSVLPPCVWHCLCPFCTNSVCVCVCVCVFYEAIVSKTTSGEWTCISQ